MLWSIRPVLDRGLTILAFVQYFLGNPEASLIGLFIPLLFLTIYIFNCRKILIGKFPILPATLTVTLIISPLLFITPSYIETSVVVENKEIRITGIYGEKIPLNQVKDVFLADTLPNITMRTNGISTGTINKGYFRSGSLRKNVKMLLHSQSKPYLYIIYGNNKYVILNLKKRKKTQMVYEQLKGVVGNE